VVPAGKHYHVVTAAGEKGTEVSADPSGAIDRYSHDFNAGEEVKFVTTMLFEAQESIRESSTCFVSRESSRARHPVAVILHGHSTCT
jgi:hypothetical protein